MIIFVIAFCSRLASLVFYTDVIKIQNYAEHSLANWIQLSGAFIFYLLSTIALQSTKWTILQRRLLTICFIIFVLLISFGVSYTVSLHNTKNTLTMFLIGIVSVSLFFAIEYREILGIAIFMVIVFILSMVLPKIAFQEKIMNVIAAFILGFILMGSSRYSYYFKSMHFVRLKQLEEKNEEIQHLNTQKGEILAFVAHDLRNPLNNIETLSKLLLAEDKQHSEARMISAAAHQAKEIINDLIEAVKLDQPVMQTERIAVAPFLQSILEKWSSNQQRTFNLIGADQNAFAYINRSKMERVIDNLISNGLKFSDPEQPLDIELSVHEQNVCIAIMDYGIGIPKKLQQHVFDQFSKAGRTGLKGEKSVGLGLHISKRIIVQHKGTLLMKSEENKGTTFTILLPLA
ncbi:HAMP domain-containing sensor histidine kinase [Pedobacter sp. KR3-3]|uniref:histidine kinase n=1 Tax=Pedobacter albus TaxID=3113905 RepID=A0ABU7I2T0_9SPHI|nr:HAMP domain-containing sensor histidine kinase [Pedobacter sp. KR3-3]MEE1943717.1 HAMP domain-containing sensor histidine kinase [Pedobacter sp. KR3-3]